MTVYRQGMKTAFCAFICRGTKPQNPNVSKSKRPEEVIVMRESKEKAVQKKDRKEVSRQRREYLPAADIYETDEAVIIRFDVPGVAQDEIDIRLDNTELQVSAPQHEVNLEGMDLIVGEYDDGVFRRKFTIPQRIDRDRIAAHLRNGVLNLELPKVEQAKPRKIKVTA
ncbi:Hsp20/alpha crystallin family protein [Verrucomicrobia bacterium S94]|nr:Hsp20/alpha crystallin family protein [Verrucomicrobia bacterium S94]